MPQVPRLHRQARQKGRDVVNNEESVALDAQIQAAVKPMWDALQEAAKHLRAVLDAWRDAGLVGEAVELPQGDPATTTGRRVEEALKRIRMAQNSEEMLAESEFVMVLVRDLEQAFGILANETARMDPPCETQAWTLDCPFVDENGDGCRVAEKGSTKCWQMWAFWKVSQI